MRGWEASLSTLFPAPRPSDGLMRNSAHVPSSTNNRNGEIQRPCSTVGEQGLGVLDILHQCAAADVPGGWRLLLHMREI